MELKMKLAKWFEGKTFTKTNKSFSPSCGWLPGYHRVATMYNVQYLENGITGQGNVTQIEFDKLKIMGLIK